MDVADFETICNALIARRETCEAHLNHIKTKEDFENLTIKQAKELKAFCTEELVKQSNILMVDFYHVVGMTNMSAVQLAKFIKLIKEYASYRPALNAIGKKDLDLNNLPDIPTATKFRPLELGDLTIYSDRGSNKADAVEELETVATRTIQRPVDNALAELTADQLPYTYFNRQTCEIRYNIADAEKVAQFLVAHTVTFGDFKVKNLVAHLSGTCAYGPYKFVSDGARCVGTLNKTAIGNMPDVVSKMGVLPEKGVGVTC